MTRYAVGARALPRAWSPLNWHRSYSLGRPYSAGRPFGCPGSRYFGHPLGRHSGNDFGRHSGDDFGQRSGNGFGRSSGHGRHFSHGQPPAGPGGAPTLDSLHRQQLALLSPPDLALTYPEGSQHLNPQHFYQVSLRKWLQRPPRPLTLAQMVHYGRHMSKRKILASANHVAEELTIRFAHRIRQMQQLPYRLMGHPALLDTYEQYLDSFEMLRRIGTVRSLADNDDLIVTGQRLLEKHTKVVTNVITGLRDIVNRPHKPGDAALLNELAKALLTSRLSRRVLVKQHSVLTAAWQSGMDNIPDNNKVGEFVLDCRIVDALQAVESRAKAILSQVFDQPIAAMPRVLVEGAPEDIAATFPYIARHFEFALGELLYNSLEACLRQGITDPIVVTVSATSDSVLVRISDRAGGLSADQQQHLWSFVGPAEPDDSRRAITARDLAEHQFFSLLFPTEELPESGPGRPSGQPDTRHFGLGLALSRLYVEYWGGALELHSLDGFGCDALLRVSRTGAKRENLMLH